MSTPMVKLLRPLDPYEPQKRPLKVPASAPESNHHAGDARTWIPPQAVRAEPEPALSEQWLRFLLNAILETQVGIRALPQLRRFLEAQLYRLLEFSKRRPEIRLTLGSIQTCRPVVTAVEVCGTVRADTRVLALAARLEHVSGEWICVAFAILDGQE